MEQLHRNDEDKILYTYKYVQTEETRVWQFIHVSIHVWMYASMHKCVYIYIIYPNVYIYIRSININKGVGINYAFFSNQYIYIHN